MAPKYTIPDSAAILPMLASFGQSLNSLAHESAMADLFLQVARSIVPERWVALRTPDPQSFGLVHAYGNDHELRPDIARNPIRLTQDAIADTSLSAAAQNNGLLCLVNNWDSPFIGVPTGFSIPLVCSGELMGVVDVGYPLSPSSQPRAQPFPQSDKTVLTPFATHLASALSTRRVGEECEALRDFQSQFMEHTDALVLGIDTTWRIKVCNRSLTELIGMSTTDLLGQDLRTVFPAANPQELARAFEAGLRGKDDRTFHAELLSRAERKVAVVWRVVSIRLRGKVQAVIAVGQDQTGLSELQKQLIQAEKLSTLGQLTAGVVHELNNPLTSIGVYSAFLLAKTERQLTTMTEEVDAEDKAADLEKLRQIHASVERIKVFTRDLIQYAKPSRAPRQRVPLNRVVSQSLSFCAHLFKNQLTLVQNLSNQELLVDAVPGQLEQVLINLITNAVQALGESGTVLVKTDLNAKGQAVLVVQDDGAGIPPEDQARIFEPFFTTKTDGTGTGLGLSIVRNIIEDHGGILTMDSHPEKGTKFRCLLPISSS